MKNAWMDIFEPEISERVNIARADERRTNLYDYVQDGGMTLDYAARRAGLTVDQFLTEMTSHGYHLPQGLQNM